MTRCHDLHSGATGIIVPGRPDCTNNPAFVVILSSDLHPELFRTAVDRRG